MSLKNLRIFKEASFDKKEVKNILNNRRIRKIRFFLLGPEGTNISQASRLWAREMDLLKKSSFIYVGSPEEGLIAAKNISDEEIIPVIPTCAVYFNLYKMFFNFCDCLLFMDHIYMKLDRMQIASNMETTVIPIHWKIACHPSPKPLLKDFPNIVIETSSNAYAAKMCSEKQVECCITTESARSLYDLHTVHCFGSPVMPFFFGTTNYGISVMEKIKAQSL